MECFLMFLTTADVLPKQLFGDINTFASHKGGYYLVAYKMHFHKNNKSLFRRNCENLHNNLSHM